MSKRKYDDAFIDDDFEVDDEIINDNDNDNDDDVNDQDYVDDNEDEESDIWDEYKYDDNDVNALNNNIDKYVSCNSDKGKKKKLTNNEKKLKCWVSSTATKYYLLGDQCIDWLMRYYNKYGIQSKELNNNEKKNNSNLLSEAKHIDELLMNGGCAFEEKIYDRLSERFGRKFIIVSNDDDIKKFISEKNITGHIHKKYMEVKKHMNNGVPIIAQAPLINKNNRTYGIADIIVRSDYVEKIFKNFDSDDEIYQPSQLKNNPNYHYRVIDCKWTTMTLCVDGKTIRNDSMFPAYKGQLAIYTGALEEIQGYIPRYAYILAKSWKITTKKAMEKKYSNDAFDRPGIIDYKVRDNRFILETKQAVKWIQRVMTEGSKWRYHKDRPSVPEMHPNMCKSINPCFDKIKEHIALRYGEPTLLWNVSKKHREKLTDTDVYDIRDKDFSIDMLGINIKGDSDVICRGTIIQKIIDINKKDSTELILPKKVNNNMFEWQTKNNSSFEYYIDFETLNYNLYTDASDIDVDYSDDSRNIIFMIGIGFHHDKNYDTTKILNAITKNKNYNSTYTTNISYEDKWEFVCFYLNEIDDKKFDDDILIMMFDFITLRHSIMEKRIKTYDTSYVKSKIFHWTGAELRFMNSSVNKTNDDVVISKYNLFRNISLWIDMCFVFQSEPIVIKGAWRFKLKNVGNAFYKNGFIKSKWPDSKIANGFIAMLEATKLYKSNNINCDLYDEIIKYNETDCRIIWEIVEYLRNNLV
jgi:hypothetical protein